MVALEESIRKHRDQLNKTHTEFRQRWATATGEKKAMEEEKQTLQTTVSDLRNQIQVLTANLGGQLNTLRSEKAALEKSLEVEKATKGSNPSSGQDAVIVSRNSSLTCSLLIVFRWLFGKNVINCWPKKNLGSTPLLVAMLPLVRQMRPSVNGHRRKLSWSKLVILLHLKRRYESLF